MTAEQAPSTWLATCADGGGRVPLLTLSEPTELEVVELSKRLALSAELTQALSVRHPRARLLMRDDGLALIVRTHVPGGPRAGRGEVTAVVTANGAALVGRGSPSVLSEVADTLGTGQQQPAAVLVALVDVVISGAGQVLERLEEEIERIEEGLFGAESVDHTRAIHAVKRELLEVRRSVVPLVTDVTRLSGEGTWSTHLPEDLRSRFALLLAQASHSAEGVEHLDALTSSVLAAQLAQIGVRQNQDQRKIAAWAAIALVPTGVGAVYGMNFENMPELTWELGYPAALMTILVLCVSLYVGFRRNGWL